MKPGTTPRALCVRGFFVAGWIRGRVDPWPGWIRGPGGSAVRVDPWQGGSVARVDPWPGWIRGPGGSVAGWIRGRVDPWPGWKSGAFGLVGRLGRFPAAERKNTLFGRRYQKTNFRPVTMAYVFLPPLRFFELKPPLRFFEPKK